MRIPSALAGLASLTHLFLRAESLQAGVKMSIFSYRGIHDSMLGVGKAT